MYGWEAIKPATRSALYCNWKYRAFFDSLNSRVKLSYREPPPRATTFDPVSSFLSEYAFGVPGLLWRSDQFLRASKNKEVDQYMVLRLLTELGICIGRLKHWHLMWTQGFHSRPHYRTVATSTFKTFRTLCGNFYDVFPMAYDFSCPEYETDFRILCLCLLDLDQAIMDINKAFPQHCQGLQLELQLRTAENDAATCAADLCMLIPYSSQPHNMTFASIHSFRPLHYALRYYESQGKQLQLAWCLHVSRSLTLKYGTEIRFAE